MVRRCPYGAKIIRAAGGFAYHRLAGHAISRALFELPRIKATWVGIAAISEALAGFSDALCLSLLLAGRPSVVYMCVCPWAVAAVLLLLSPVACRRSPVVSDTFGRLSPLTCSVSRVTHCCVVCLSRSCVLLSRMLDARDPFLMHLHLHDAPHTPRPTATAARLTTAGRHCTLRLIHA
eukprot:scaffold8100_cov117-Isochrysis_galbana.AAC.1